MRHINFIDTVSLFRGELILPSEGILHINTTHYSIREISPLKNYDFTKHDIVIRESHDDFRVVFINCKFKNITIDGSFHINFQDCSFNKVRIADRTSAHYFSFNGGVIDYLTGFLSNPDFKNVEVGKLDYIDQLNLDGFELVDELIFSENSGSFDTVKLDCRFKNIGFLNYESYEDPMGYASPGGTIESYNPDKNSVVRIQGSDLEGITFFNCNMFDSQIEFHNSNLTELRYINSVLPKNVTDIDSKRESTEAYRQLKIVSKKQYDRFSELIYKAKEQNAYLKDIIFNSKKLGSFRKWIAYCKNNFNSLIVLGFGKFSNYYGTKWWPSLLLILGIGFGSYCGYLSSICSNIMGFEEFWQKYWLFITPFHNIHLMGDEYSYSGLSYFIDIFHRIINYFLIYQGVQAFRMYGKD